MPELSQLAFAKKVGVCRNAIIVAIKTGKLIKLKNRKIDTECRKSKNYINTQVSKKRSSQKKELDKNQLAEINKKKSGGATQGGGKGKKKAVAVKKKTKVIDKKAPVKKRTVDIPDISDVENNDEMFDSNLEWHKIQKMKVETDKNKVAMAKDIGVLIPRSVFKTAMGNFAASILNFFFPMGERLAPMVCGACKITDPDIIMKVKKIIDKEVTRAIQDVKEKSKMKQYEDVEGDE